MCWCFLGLCGWILNWISDIWLYIFLKDFEVRRWYECGKCLWFNFLFLFLILFLVLVDMVMDVRVVVFYYCCGDDIWVLFMFVFVIILVVIIEIVFVNWYLEDEKGYKKEIFKKYGLEIKKWYYLCYFILCGIFLR